MTMSKTRRELAEEQLELMYKIQATSKVNIVTCGNCGSVIFHKMTEGIDLNADDIQCYDCMEVMDISDCPDLWYDGAPDSRLYDEEQYDNLNNEI